MPSAPSAAPCLRLQPVAEGLDLAQRLLEVVRGDEGEVLELAVAALELEGRLLEAFVGGGELGRPLGDPRLELVVRGAQGLLGALALPDVAVGEVGDGGRPGRGGGGWRATASTAPSGRSPSPPRRAAAAAGSPPPSCRRRPSGSPPWCAAPRRRAGWRARLPRRPPGGGRSPPRAALSAPRGEAAAPRAAAAGWGCPPSGSGSGRGAARARRGRFCRGTDSCPRR